mmetsp:Transcript_119871/g.245127  ORF Transcript_119871/g.245127 Transcript_119871/m.245127 type:complete len:92 (-) Transcript_119871:687-962(-)
MQANNKNNTIRTVRLRKSCTLTHLPSKPKLVSSHTALPDANLCFLSPSSVFNLTIQGMQAGVCIVFENFEYLTLFLACICLRCVCLAFGNR